jgi:thiol-disulfide isomerase/thioredoxin
VLCIAVLLGSACAAPDTGEQGGRTRSRPVAPVVGERAPLYRIATLDGDSLVLGPSPSIVLLNVWATWCTSCKEEFAHMDSLLARHAADGLRVVAVSVDVGETALVRETLSSYAVSFEAAHDQAGEIETRFPAFGVPASYLIDRAGVLRWRHVGVLPASVDSVVAALVREPAASAATVASPSPLANGAGGQ